MKWFPPALVVASLVASVPQRTPAATFTVTNTNDSGADSLRAAIASAEADTVLDTIDFDTAGVFASAQTITLTSGPLAITRPVLIDGPNGANRVTIDGNDADVVFDLDLNSSNVVTLDHLTIRDGGGLYAVWCNRNSTTAHFTIQNCTIESSSGGAVFLAGLLEDGSYGAGDFEIYDTIITTSGGRGLTLSNVKVRMERCEITDNALEGIQGNGDVTIEDSEISGNENGGIYLVTPFDTEDFSPEGALSMHRCLVSGNTRAANGGGVSTIDTEIELVDCTISGNESNADGGGIALSRSDSIIVHCTITGNSADAENNGTGNGGGIALILDSSDVTLRNSIVAENEDTPDNAGTGSIHPDLSGDFVPRLDSSPFVDREAFGNNLIGAIDGATGFFNGENGDIVGTLAIRVPAGLEPLANNGGPTRTHALNPLSRAFDNGSSAFVAFPPFEPAPFTDQRGDERIIGNAPDIGAFERQTVLIVTSAAASGAGTLRQALADAAATAPAEETIVFDTAGTFASAQTIHLGGTQLLVDSSINIIGPADNRVILDADLNSRVLKVDGAVEVRLRNLVLRQGTAPVTNTDGGGILVEDAGGALTLVECEIRNCHADGRGGGIFMAAGTEVGVSRSLLVGNTAFDHGGGVAAPAGGTLTVINSTVSGNESDGHGGGIYTLADTTEIDSSTISNNLADADADNNGNGGGVRRGNTATGPVTVGNSIIAGNFDSPANGSSSPLHPDISGEFVSAGYNLIGVDAGLDVGGTPFQNGVNGDQVGTLAAPIDPLLTALADNGGVTRTHALDAASPALDAGGNGLLLLPPYPAALVDQRGARRIAPTGGAVDIGAFERTSSVISLSATDGIGVEWNGDAVVFHFQRPENVAGATVRLALDAGSGTQFDEFTWTNATLVDAQTLDVTIPDGAIGFDVTGTPLDDAIPEPAEVLTVDLLPLSLAEVQPGADTAAAVIYSDEMAVTTTADSGAGSLRDVIGYAGFANGAPLGLKVSFDTTGVFGTPQTITLTTGHLAPQLVVTVDGAGADVTLTNPTGRIFYVIDAFLNLRNLTISDCTASGFLGGGIYGNGANLDARDCVFSNCSASVGGAIAAEDDTMVVLLRCIFTGNTATDSSFGDGSGAVHLDGGIGEITDCTFTGNSALLGNGGALLSSATSLQITRTLFDGNSSNGSGGAIYALDDLALTDCTVADNSAVVAGGGVFCTEGAFVNSTFSGNSTAGSGGGIYFTSIGAALSFDHATIANNTADSNNDGTGNGGGIFNSGAASAAEVNNTIIAGNFDTPNNAGASTRHPDVSGDFVSLGFNLVRINAGLGAGGTPFSHGVNGDLVGTAGGPINPGLLPLADNGGPTPTHALMFGSVAIDAGSNAGAPAADQRGLARIANAITDMGAYEFQAISYAYWSGYAFPEGTPAEEMEADADYDGDGRANAIEFLFGTDPLMPDDGGIVSVYLDGNDLVMEFHRSVLVALTGAEVQRSFDLITWLNTGITLQNLGLVGPNLELWKAFAPMGAETRQFMRIAYTVP